MKKKRVTEILNVPTKQKQKMLLFALGIFALFLIGTVLLITFISLNKTYYVSYKENSDLDYKVYLKDNEYFENKYVEKDNEYISTLINYIDADFNYDLEMIEEVSNYKYSYSIVAEVNVKSKNSEDLIYQTEEVLIEEQTFTSVGKENVSINENVLIDYVKYNDLINKFVKTYKLEDAISTLSVSMYVDVHGTCSDYNEESYNRSVVKLDIPLTTNTLSIDMNYDLVDNAEGVMVCKDENENAFFILVLSILCYGFAIWLIVAMVKYVYSTRTAESIYNRELKKILRNYSSYIQKINNHFEMDGYQMLKVDTFNDMLEIRDTIQEPILMVENNKDCTYFLIPSKTKILYSYRLKVDGIKIEAEKNLEEK